MTVRGYAKARGMAHTTVDYQIRKDRIPKDADGMIDADYADYVFSQLIDKKQSARAKPKASASAEPPPPLPDGVDLEFLRQRVPTSFADAQYLGMVEDLQKRRMANGESEGRLLDADQVHQTQFELARQIRDAMMSIPSRIAEQLAAEPDAAACARMLEREIRLALESAAKQVSALDDELLAGDGEPD